MKTGFSVIGTEDEVVFPTAVQVPLQNDGNNVPDHKFVIGQEQAEEP